jgi:glycosyltransferase involved in cell wall biosynthesis
MKIAYFTITIGRGGAERLLLQICSEFKKNYSGVNAELVVFKKTEDDLAPFFLEANVPVTFLDIDDNSFTRHSFSTIYKWIKQNIPDVVHSHCGARMDRFVLLAGLFAGIKNRICTIHNMDQIPSLRARVSFGILSALSRKIVAVSEGARNFYQESHFFNPKKVTVIYNCPGFKTCKIEPRNTGLRDKTEIKLLHIGSLRVQKGQVYLIKALKLLQMSNYTFRLDIYGADRFGYGHIVHKEVLDSNLTNVFFKGETEDVEAVLQDADILIASSIREALPLVPLEALSFGLPIVATNILPHREILGPVESKILVEVSNPKAIADAILNLVNDDVLYTKYSKEALNRSSDFSVERAANKHCELYNE